MLSDFAKKCRNIWGSVRHKPAAMFKKYSRQHNNGVPLGFIKSSECRMAGEHIALLRLLQLRPALKATVTSKEYQDLKLKSFNSAVDMIMLDSFWKYLFVMCRALYAPMRVLRLADQKTPAMDKLYYYVLQTDRMLPLYLKKVEDTSNSFLNQTAITTIGNIPSAGDSDAESDNDEDNDDDCADDDDDEEDDNEDDDEDDNEDEDVETDNDVLQEPSERQVWMHHVMVLLFHHYCAVTSNQSLLSQSTVHITLGLETP